MNTTATLIFPASAPAIAALSKFPTFNRLLQDAQSDKSSFLIPVAKYLFTDAVHDEEQQQFLEAYRPHKQNSVFELKDLLEDTALLPAVEYAFVAWIKSCAEQSKVRIMIEIDEGSSLASTNARWDFAYHDLDYWPKKSDATTEVLSVYNFRGMDRQRYASIVKNGEGQITKDLSRWEDR